MTRLLAFLLACLPLAAAAGPEVQLTPGLTTDFVSPSGVVARDTGPTFRVAAGWSFYGHAVAIGLQADPFRAGSLRGGGPFLSYRLPAHTFDTGVGLTGFVSVRDATFGCASARCAVGEPPEARIHHWPIATAGIGVTFPYEWLLVMPALEVGGASPGALNRPGFPKVVDLDGMLVVAGTVSLIVRHDPEAAGPQLAGGHWVPRVAVFAGPLVGGGRGGVSLGGFGGGSAALGLAWAAWEVGARLDLAGSSDSLGAGFAGPALSASVERALTPVGTGVLRGAIGAGVASPMRCGGDNCRPSLEPLFSLDGVVSWPGGFEAGARVSGDYDDSREREFVLAAAVVGWAWR